MNEEIKAFANVDPEIMGGTPCFKGTRVPLTHLTWWLGNDEFTQDFLENFPSVEKEQIEACLAFLSKQLEEQALVAYESAA